MRRTEQVAVWVLWRMALLVMRIFVITASGEIELPLSSDQSVEDSRGYRHTSTHNSARFTCHRRALGFVRAQGHSQIPSFFRVRGVIGVGENCSQSQEVVVRGLAARLSQFRDFG
jgi:hypothetical protein